MELLAILNIFMFRYNMAVGIIGCHCETPRLFRWKLISNGIIFTSAIIYVQKFDLETNDGSNNIYFYVYVKPRSVLRS